MATRPLVLLGSMALLVIAAAVPVRDARAAEPIITKHVSISTSSTPDAVAGGRVSLIVAITPRPNMHVYAPGQKDLIPISLKLAPLAAFKADSVQFPRPEKLEVKELGETQLVYSQPFRLVQDITLAKDARSRANIIIKGTLKYQACDNTICYAPVTVPVAWTIALRRDAAPVQK